MITYDTDLETADCYDVLQTLYKAILVIGGGARARGRYGTRWSEYHAGNADAMRKAYQTLKYQCKDPRAQNDLPDMAVGFSALRGPPGYFPIG
jgi:hypothetical protein